MIFSACNKSFSKKPCHAYVLTWIQNGDYMTFTPRNQDTAYCVSMWVNCALNYLPECCSDNRMFDGCRLVCRQATYQGV